MLSSANSDFLMTPDSSGVNQNVVIGVMVPPQLCFQLLCLIVLNLFAAIECNSLTGPFTCLLADDYASGHHEQE